MLIYFGSGHEYTKPNCFSVKALGDLVLFFGLCSMGKRTKGRAHE